MAGWRGWRPPSARSAAGWASPYGPGQGPYEDHGFADNELTHSTARYQAFRQIYEQHPQVRLGAPPPTGSIRPSQDRTRPQPTPGAIKTPLLLLLQAGEDSVVDNAAQGLLRQGPM